MAVLCPRKHMRICIIRLTYFKKLLKVLPVCVKSSRAENYRAVALRKGSLTWRPTLYVRSQQHSSRASLGVGQGEARRRLADYSSNQPQPSSHHLPYFPYIQLPELRLFVHKVTAGANACADVRHIFMHV